MRNYVLDIYPCAKFGCISISGASLKYVKYYANVPFLLVRCPVLTFFLGHAHRSNPWMDFYG